MRTAYYIVSTHWDREWYEPFQGFRMRLVSLLDEVLDLFDHDPAFASFVMDGQTIPILDYLEIRPERRPRIEQLVRAGRLKLGPWFTLPDEWLVSGESLVRNLQMGRRAAEGFGAPASRAGLVADEFGHTGQLPQIFAQMGLPLALVWRGTQETELGGHFLWSGPDGTTLPAYRFPQAGYSTLAFDVRHALKREEPFDLDQAIERLVAFTLKEARRSPLGPILLFDGGDHLEVEPRTSALVAGASAKLEAQGIRIIHSDLDTYVEAVLAEQGRITRRALGELRQPGREPMAIDEQWLIPGVLSSRVHLKQRNAACEDELCLWAEPWSAFASLLGREYPRTYLETAWKHLLENHAHDSICGCSPDPIHQDMVYRFDQSLGIASRLTGRALAAIAERAAPALATGDSSAPPPESLAVCLFNASSVPFEGVADVDLPLPTDWPARYQEFFGYEEKFALRLSDAGGREVPWQLCGQDRDRRSVRPIRYKFAQGQTHHVLRLAARVRVPALGYTTLLARPADGPTRATGSLASTAAGIENEHLRLQVAPDGALELLDRATGQQFRRLLTFEDRADIGDGWFHGLAVNDQVFGSTACPAQVSLLCDGPLKATLRVQVTLQVPEAFDFRALRRSDRLAPLRLTTDLTLRAGARCLEALITVENTVLDHRLRVLLPTDLAGDRYLADAAFDVVERPVALAADNATRRELDVDHRPQQAFTAFGDGRRGLAVLSRGLYESNVLDRSDRSIALTLLRGFRRAVYSNDNPGGQVPGTHTFRIGIVPFTGPAPVDDLLRQAQALAHPPRAQITPLRRLPTGPAALPAERSHLAVHGPVHVTSVQRSGEQLLVRLFNPHARVSPVTLDLGAAVRQVRAEDLQGEPMPAVRVAAEGRQVRLELPAKRIVTLALTLEG